MADQKIIEYISQSLSSGKSKEDIYQQLLVEGVKIESIEDALNSISSKGQKEDLSKKTVKVILTVGVFLVGAGIFSFISSNWQLMSKPLKVFVILISMILCYFIGWYAKEKYNFVKTGESFILLGVIVYGAGIFLVAQMFNISTSWPDGFILWMLGAIIMGFAVDLYSSFYLAILLGAIAFIGHPFLIFAHGSIYSPVVTSSFLLLLSALATFFTGLSIKKRIPSDIKNFY
jgi:uncharacterized membrane protein